MARFHVYPNTGGAGYLVDVQADAMSNFNTRVVIPLLPLDAAPLPAKILNPVFDVGGQPHSLVTQYMAAVPSRLLQTPVFNAESRRGEIVAAIDLLLQGF